MAVMLNGAAEKHARSLIEAGSLDKETAWSFDGVDGDNLLGSDGTDWANYSKWFLGVDAEANNETKDHYKYPIGKDGKVYRSALIAIRQRASQQDATGIYEAAGKLIDAIDGGKASTRSVSRKTRACGFSIKTITPEGVFSGYGSVYDVVDDGGDIVAPGAFKDSLKEWKSKGRMPAMLWQHCWDEPIGVYTTITEDEHGLFVEGQLALKTQRGAEAYELMKMGAISGLSIGFVTRDDSWDQKTGVRTIKQADLWEVSPVTFPMNDEARVDDVKSLIDEIADLKGAERLLRDAGGFSRSNAKSLLARLKNLTLRDAADEEEAEAKETRTQSEELKAIRALLEKRQQVLAT